MAVGEQVAEEAPDELLSFVPLPNEGGLEIVDHIERRHFVINSSSRVRPNRTSTSAFEFPVNRATTIETDEIEIPNQFGAIIRNSLGFMVAEVTKGDERAFPRDVYSIDPGAPIKTYIKFDAAFEVAVTGDGLRLTFESVSTIDIGVRSHHKHPAASIKTTDSVSDLMEAVSYFSSALKTTSCERSYPTLRGHPPTLEIGDTFEIPSVLTRPETGVTIEIPPDRRHVYAISTMAYYFGAEIVPGDSAKISTDTGFEYPLSGTKRGFEGEVERVLKQAFFFDCITRTEGFFQVNQHERNEIEEWVQLDFVELYDADLGTQLESYLEIPYELIRPYLPTWKLTAHVTPDPTYADTLPFLVNDLAVIKTVDDSGQANSSIRSTGADEFVRRYDRVEPTDARSVIESAQPPELVRVKDDEGSLEQAWVGEGAPIGASKAMIEAFENRLSRTPADGDIDITVVCNEAEMGQERDVVNEVYGSRKELPLDVSIHRELTVDELRDLLSQDTDFFHYIGHIDAGGFECTDGRLDAASIEHTGVDVFFLNACTSYAQGRNLIKAGSIAGVVTLQDVINSGAERVGMMLARLLNWGFPLRPALNLAQKKSIMGGHYLVIGDGSIDIAQPRVGIQGLCDISRKNDEWYLRFLSFPTRDREMGTIVTPNISSCDEIFLISKSTQSYRLDEDELSDYLEVEEMPIRYEGEITWSSEFLNKFV